MKQVFFLAIITLFLYETSAKVTGPKSAYDLEKRLRDLTESGTRNNPKGGGLGPVLTVFCTVEPCITTIA